MKMNEFDITNYSDDEVISLYPKILKNSQKKISIKIFINEKKLF